MNLDSTHMAIPMAVAHRLLDCYYGAGPRNSGSIPATEVDPSSAEAVATGIPTPTGGVDPQRGYEGSFPTPDTTIVRETMPGWVQKGWGATTPPVKGPPTTA